jgi:leader peptidase (prepilin peptidase) / N-methyltransferase
VTAETWPIVVLVAVTGLAVGSFLNVVIYRVPEGLSVLHPPSRCPSCGHRIRPWENIPVLSWLLLRGRCSGCGARISARYPFVELLTGALWVAMLWRFDVSLELPAYLFLVSVGVALAFIDLDHKRLPDVLTLPSYPVALALLLLPAALDGAWDSYLRAVLSGVALLLLYGILWFVYPSGMGFGDVKLAGVLGIYLGWLSWGLLVLGGFLGFLLGAVVGVALLVLGRATRKTGVPFGPFMLAGTVIAVLWGDAVVDWYASLAFG